MKSLSASDRSSHLQELVRQAYQDHAFYLQRRAFAILRDETASHDVVHEVFLRLIRELDRGRIDACSLYYLIRVTTNHCIDLIRSKRVRKEEILQTELAAPASSQTLFNQTLATELMAQIPTPLKEIAVYHYIDGFTAAEIAHLTGHSERTVKRRLQALKKTLARFV